MLDIANPGVSAGQNAGKRCQCFGGQEEGMSKSNGGVKGNINKGKAII